MSSPGSSQDVPHQQHAQPTSNPISPPPSASQHDVEESSFLTNSSSSPHQDHDTSFASSTGEHEERHPRARRKRTGLHDKMILEEYYQKDSKPDKSMRLKLVERVSLSEKEVQVWFQNRRQNDRRKSRPLTQQEIADLQCHGIRPLNVDDGSSHSWSVLKVTQAPMPVSDPAQSPPSSSQTFPSASQTEANNHSRSLSDVAISHHNLNSSSPQEPRRTSRGPPYSGVGYIANRRRENGSFSTPVTQTPSTFNRTFNPLQTPKDLSSPRSGSPNTTPQSQIRLSCSIDGKAEVMSGDEPPSSSMPELHSSSPSVPTLPSGRELRRTQSAFAPDLSQLARPTSISHILNPMPFQARSRDVNVWESCASSQTQQSDELSMFAEHDLMGSATAKISLLRSSSSTSLSGTHGASRSHNSRGILQPSGGSKRNAPLPQPGSLRRDASHVAKRAKLGRTHSSLARLGTQEKLSKSSPAPEPLKETDSDKENWTPSREQWSEHAEEVDSPDYSQRRCLLPGASVSIGGRGSPPLLHARAKTAPVRRARGREQRVEIYVDEDGEQGDDEALQEDEEVESFMKGGNVSPRKQGEMEVVAGLLSLSKGAWIHTN